MTAVQRSAPTARFTAADVEATLLELLRHATGGEFDVERELGRGGMAMVYLATDTSLNRQVAIKVMSPSLGGDKSMAERFLREAQTAASLSHPNIIPVYAVRHTESVTYFVMKYIQGRPLDDIMDEVGAMPIPLVMAILTQVAGALGYGHKRGVVHRDVKPGNVMIDDEGWAVVMDFGIAKVEAAEGLTQTGAAIGTPTYMSPEQCTAKPVGGASDQYSLGVVAYEMLTGRKPFEGDSVMSIMYGHVNEPPPPFLDIRPDCPPALHEVVMRMLSKSPGDRFPDMEGLVAALGATPVQQDESIRTEMMTLAASGLGEKVLQHMRTPRTPVPLASIQKSGVRPSAPTLRTPSPASAIDDSGDRVSSQQGSRPRPKRSKAGAVVAVAAILIVGAGGTFLWAPWDEGSLPAEVPETQDPAPAEPVTPTGPTVAALAIVDPPGTSLVAGGELELAVTVEDPSGSPLGPDVAPVTWRSSDAAVATVTDGLVIAQREGTVTISAESGDFDDSVILTVTAPPPDRPPPPRVASVRVAPRSEQLAPGESIQLSATAVDANGRTLDRTLSWSSSDADVARVSRSGLVTAVSPGSATITASRDAGTGSAAVTVTALPVASVSVSPGSVQLDVGGTATFVAVARNRNGEPVSDRRAEWRSSASSVASVDASGRVTAIAGGAATITATIDGIQGGGQVSVADAPPVVEEPSGPTEAESRAQIRQILENYRQAFESRDIEAVRRAYPGMTAQQESRWRTFFDGVESLTVGLTENDLTISGSTAQAAVATRYQFRMARGPGGEQDFVAAFSFELRPTGWTMVRWEAR